MLVAIIKSTPEIAALVFADRFEVGQVFWLDYVLVISKRFKILPGIDVPIPIEPCFTFPSGQSFEFRAIEAIDLEIV